MGLIGSKRFVAAVAVVVVAKSVLIAGLLASPVGPAPTLASGADGDPVDAPQVQNNGTSPDDVTEDPGQGGSDDDGSGDGCLLVCDPLPY